MKREKLTIKNRDGISLSANLAMPDDTPNNRMALFAHCFTCSKDLSIVKTISKKLTGQGIAVLSFDFTGLGQSEGEFSDSNFSNNIDDLIDTSNYLKENYNEPTILIGHSLGGAAVIKAANMLDQVEAVITIGAPSQAKHVSHLVTDKSKIETEGEAEISIGGRPFTIKKQFLEDLDEHDLREETEKLRTPLLIFHSPQDNIVGIDNAAEIYKHAHHPKSFISLDGADHLLSDKEDAVYVATLIAAWMERYVNRK